MDTPTVNYSEERYLEIQNELTTSLKKIGYKEENITFVPISGFEGENLLERSNKMEWYKGRCLYEILDSV